MKRFKVVLLIVLMLMFVTLLTSCKSTERLSVDLKSSFTGLNRVINVYTANGELMARYEGKIDIQASEGGYVKFDLDGKRYIYYNCFVETIADI